MASQDHQLSWRYAPPAAGTAVLRTSRSSIRAATRAARPRGVRLSSNIARIARSRSGPWGQALSRGVGGRAARATPLVGYACELDGDDCSGSLTARVRAPCRPWCPRRPAAACRCSRETHLPAAGCFGDGGAGVGRHPEAHPAYVDLLLFHVEQLRFIRTHLGAAVMQIQLVCGGRSGLRSRPEGGRHPLPAGEPLLKDRVDRGEHPTACP